MVESIPRINTKAETWQLQRQLKDTMDVRQSMRNYIYTYQEDKPDPAQARLVASYTQDIIELNAELHKRGF